MIDIFNITFNGVSRFRRLAKPFMLLNLAAMILITSLSCGPGVDIGENTITITLNPDGRSGSIGQIICITYENEEEQKQLQELLNYDDISIYDFNDITVRIWDTGLESNIFEPSICSSWKADFSDPKEIVGICGIMFEDWNPPRINIDEVQSSILKTKWSISINVDDNPLVIVNAKWIFNMPAQIKEVSIVPSSENKKIHQKMSAEGRTLELTFPNQDDQMPMENSFTITVIAEESRVSSVILMPIMIGLACSIIFGGLGYFLRQIIERRKGSV